MKAIRGFSKILPLDNLLLVDVHYQDQTPGGLYVPDTARDEIPPYAVVLACGPDVTGVEVGMCVYPRLGASVGRIFGENGAEYELWRRDQVNAIVMPSGVEEVQAAE